MTRNAGKPQSQYRVIKKVYRRPRTTPQPPKKCEIVETMTGQRRHGTGIFPSRRKAGKELAKLIADLPNKSNPQEVDKYYIRNV